MSKNLKEKNNGFNNIDKIYFINLDHRTDRLENITNELYKTNIDRTKINRVPGVYLPSAPYLGCAKSHYNALSEFVNSDESNKTCAIFEDDFVFTENQEIVNDLINKVFNDLPDFHVVFLSCNLLWWDPTGYGFVDRVKTGQTLSGYLVNRSFAKILLDNFAQSIQLLESAGRSIHGYTIDTYIRNIQFDNLWYCLSPKIGKQLDSYSDIENREVNYGC